MNGPVIQSVSPAPGETDVVLGRPITILFDQPIDPASVSSATFSLQGPGQTDVVASDGSIISGVTAATGREYILGSFAFPAPESGDTFQQDQKLLFTPAAVLRTNVTYTVLIVGATSLLAKNYVRNPIGEAMTQSYRFTFTTGSINQVVTPPGAPVTVLNAWEKPVLDPSQIQVRPRPIVGNDLTQQIQLIFPAPVDSTSFDPANLLVALEPLLGDPSIVVDSVQSQIVIAGNIITITLGGPPAPKTWDTLPGTWDQQTGTWNTP